MVSSVCRVLVCECSIKNFLRFGDFRVTTGKQVILLWHKLGSHKGQFIPDLINSFLKISLLNQRDLRRIAIPLVFDVIKCEQQVNGNFKRVSSYPVLPLLRQIWLLVNPLYFKESCFG